MFSNYNNLNTSYTPGTYNQRFPTTCNCNNQIESVSPNKPFEIKDMNGQVTGYFWYQGNTLDLSWDIDGVILTDEPNSYIDVSSYIQSCELICKIYNFRREIIVKASTNKNKLSNCYPLELYADKTNQLATCVLHIDPEISQKLPKGTYTVSLTAIHPSGFDETLFDGSSCKFEVK